MRDFMLNIYLYINKYISVEFSKSFEKENVRLGVVACPATQRWRQASHKFEASLGNVNTRLSEKLKAKWASGVSQVVEHLPSNREVLS
jgi:hypothetical protein